MEKIGRFKFIIGALILLTGVVLVLLQLSFKMNVFLAAFIYIAYSFLIVLVFYFLNKWQADSDDYIESQLDSGINDAMKLANVGIVVYNDSFEVNWMSALFKERGIDCRKEKVLTWIPELQDLISGNTDETTIVLDSYKYIVTKKANANVLLFKDITVEYDLKRKYEDDAVVFG